MGPEMISKTSTILNFLFFNKIHQTRTNDQNKTHNSFNPLFFQSNSTTLPKRKLDFFDKVAEITGVSFGMTLLIYGIIILVVCSCFTYLCYFVKCFKGTRNKR